MDKIQQLAGFLIENFFQTKKGTTLFLFTAVLVIFTVSCLSKWLEMRQFFAKLKIPCDAPWPLLGNSLQIYKKPMFYSHWDLIRKHGRMVGYFDGTRPVILTTDVQFIKHFMIKDFNSFVNRRSFNELQSPPADKFLSDLKDDEWKNVRSIVSTTFTSGKLKLMSKCMKDIMKNYENYLQDVIKKDGILQTKFFYGSFTLDVISSCCFGIDVNSISDPNNEFLNYLQMIFASFVPSFTVILAFIAPKIAKILIKLKLTELLPSKALKYLESVTNEIIDRRKRKQDRRDDFIQYMIEREENPNEKDTDLSEDYQVKNADGTTWNKHLKKKLTNAEILSQSVIFLMAGYETTATTLEFITYNLVKNPHVQQKLCDEIDQVLDKHNGEINYESLSEMKYMDMVIDETLRLYPIAAGVERIASNDYEYKGLKIKKDQLIQVPLLALHHDPEYYPNPDEFQPERFSDENKKTRENEAFMPFGTGPRHCIGMRFALIEIKLLLTSVLSKYCFQICDKTPENIELLNSTILKPKDLIYVKVSPR